MSNSIRFIISIVIISTSFMPLKSQDLPFEVKPDLFDQSTQDDLGLTVAEGTETVTVFAPDSSTDKFSNGVVMVAFRDTLYCQWQSSAKDEDAQDTWVAYSRSADGLNWSEPMVLAPSLENGYCSSGGWWVAGDTLVAYINTWPADVSPRGGYTRYTTSTDGINWSELKALPMADADTLKGIFEQDPHALPDGRIINAAHFQPGLIISPIYTDDPSGIRGWTPANYTNLSISGGISREIEPSWFLRGEDSIVMIFRDQNSTFYKLASVSVDRGENWSTAVLTDMPDSRAKQSAGNLSDSTAYFASNPVTNKLRIPLALTLSRHGRYFNRAFLLRAGGDDIQDLRFAGTAKRAGYHYPKSVIWKEHLYVSYATNKEDVQYTRLPLSVLYYTDSTFVHTLPATSETGQIEFFTDRERILHIYRQGSPGNSIVNIYNINGQLLYSEIMNSSMLQIDMNHQPAGTYIMDVRTGPAKESRVFILH